MTTELTMLGWILVLALVQIMLPAFFRSNEAGLAHNMGARDEPGPAVGKITARLRRAQANLFETLPLFAVAVLIAHVAGRESILTLWGSALYLAARIVYVPLYAVGVSVIRTVVWIASLVGLLMVLSACLR